jgi:uncharacterized tellurite resistance protein B-like protein
MGDIGTCFQPKNDPEVQNGTKPTHKVLSDFFQALSTISTSGYLTEGQFIEYYKNIACFDDDNSFESLMDMLWRTPSPARSTLSGGGGSISNLSTTMSKANIKPIDSASYVKPLQQLKAALKERGATGIIGLGRLFRIMDDDGNKSLNVNEFKKAMSEFNLHLNDDEIKQLFDYFDKDRNGTIDYEEFIQSLRGDLSARRKNLINMAFDVVDKDGNGVLEPDDLIGVYDTSKHPDVLSGKKRPTKCCESSLTPSM